MHAKRTPIVFLILSTFGLSGCGPRRVRLDFSSYEKSYAVTSNREVLLNLARLEERDPTYFFKLGQISAQYRMQASLASTGSYLPAGTAGTNTLPGGSGGPGLIYESDPAFTMIPVDDQTLARLLSSPIQSDVFYDLYYQGWRVDQLFRLMVDRIEITLPNPTGNGCTVHIIRNEPPPVFKGNPQPIDYDHEQTSIASYVNFLRISAVVYALQKYEMLQLRGTTEFAPLDKNSWLPAENQPGADGKASGSNASTPQVKAANDHTTVIVTMPPAKSDAGGGNAAAPTAKDFDETAAKNQYWEMQPVMVNGKPAMVNGQPEKAWVLGQMVGHTIFQLTSSIAPENAAPETEYGEHVKDIEDRLRGVGGRPGIFGEDESLQGMDKAPELTDILEILYNGFSIEGPSEQGQADRGFCPTVWSNGAPSRLVLRSLIGVMAAAAQEQDAFEQLETDNQQILLKEPQLSAPESTLEQELRDASDETLPADQRKLAQSKFNRLAQMTMEIHMGLVKLAELQAQEKCSQAKEKCAEKQKQSTEGIAQAPSAGESRCQRSQETECPEFPTDFNRAYAQQAIKFLVAAQENSGELGEFRGLVPPIERVPVLQLDWSKREQGNNYLPPGGKPSDLKSAGFAVHYDGHDFMVTDVDFTKIPESTWKACANNAADRKLTCYAKENQYWNRDMFRLIGQLSSQVTVDISKFPLPAVLQLEP